MKHLFFILLFFGPTVNAAEFKIAFGSCADQSSPLPIWTAILEQKPNYFIFAGDNVYGSDDGIKSLKKSYKKFAKNGHLKRISEISKTLEVWDDHDYGKGDGGFEFKDQLESKKLFLKAFGAKPDDERWKHRGIYYSRHEKWDGRHIHFVLLDTRSYRSPWKASSSFKSGRGKYVPDPDPKKTLLGEEQWLWLEKELKTPSDLLILVSSIQVIAADHGWERWGNFPNEQERLLKLLEAAKSKGVLIMSGDRHYGSMYSLKDRKRPLFEITSSGLNRVFRGATAETDRYHITPQIYPENFGLITLKSDSRSALIELRGIKNEVLASQTLTY